MVLSSKEDARVDVRIQKINCVVNRCTYIVLLPTNVSLFFEFSGFLVADSTLGYFDTLSYGAMMYNANTQQRK